MQKVLLSQCVVDMTIYPRESVDAQHVSELARAVESGAELPPIVLCKNSKRVVDGVHRLRAYKKLFGDEHAVKAVFKNYSSDREMFIDAMRYNAIHGKRLTHSDRQHCLTVADRFRIGTKSLADALQVAPGHLGALSGSSRGNLVVVSKPRGTSAGSSFKKTKRWAGEGRTFLDAVPQEQRKTIQDETDVRQRAIELAGSLCAMLGNGMVDFKDEEVSKVFSRLKFLLSEAA